MPRYGDRTVYRRKDYACASGRRYVDGANPGKCMAKRKCKVRWSKKKGRCKRYASSGRSMRKRSGLYTFDDL